MGGIDSRGVISNSTQSLRISAGVRESPGDVVVKDIEGTPPLRPRLLKSLKACNGKLSKNRKTHLNATATLRAHAPVTRTEGVRPHTVGLVARLKDLLVRFLILRGRAGKIVQAGPAPVAGQRRLRFHMQRQGQDTLRNRLRRAVSGRTKRHNENMMKEK